MPDHLLAIVVPADDSTAAQALLAEALDGFSATPSRTWTEPYTAGLTDQRDELQAQIDKLSGDWPIFPPSYVEYRGGLTYEECLTVLGWYGTHHGQELATEDDEAVAVKLAPPGTDPLDPPAEEPE